MNILFQKVKIVDPSSPHHGKTLDVLVKRGKVDQIGKKIAADGVKVVNIKGACLSPGWLDIGTQIGEPGFEHREDIESVSRTALSGGYTAIAPFPNLDPLIDSQSLVSFLRNQSNASAVDFYPIGAVSKGAKGVDMAELIDMHQAGAVAFSDGKKPLNDEGLLQRALLYAMRFDGLIIDQPINYEISPEAQVHEGLSSTLMGLKGMPTTAEVSRVKRNVEIAEYTDSRLCFHLISTKESLDVLKESSKDNNRMFTSVGVFNLCFTEEDILGFDHNLKLMPPLRSGKDKSALIKGIQRGQIQIICSQHQPLEEELKEMAFFDSNPGSISLQTTFPLLISSIKDDIDLDKLISCLCHNPRRILGLDIPTIDEQMPFNATLFHTDMPWTFTKASNQSKSRNSALFDHDFNGCVIGSFNKSHAHWNVHI